MTVSRTKKKKWDPPSSKHGMVIIQYTAQLLPFFNLDINYQRFGMVSLFNGIATFTGYLKPKLSL